MSRTVSTRGVPSRREAEVARLGRIALEGRSSAPARPLRRRSGPPPAVPREPPTARWRSPGRTSPVSSERAAAKQCGARSWPPPRRTGFRRPVGVLGLFCLRSVVRCCHLAFAVGGLPARAGAGSPRVLRVVRRLECGSALRGRVRGAVLVRRERRRAPCRRNPSSGTVGGVFLLGLGSDFLGWAVSGSAASGSWDSSATGVSTTGKRFGRSRDRGTGSGSVEARGTATRTGRPTAPRVQELAQERCSPLRPLRSCHRCAEARSSDA